MKRARTTAATARRQNFALPVFAALILTALIFAMVSSPARAQERQNTSGSAFVCENGEMLSMRFGTRNTESVAMVSSGDQRHVLTLMPWDGHTPRVTWSDGQRTLTWDVGVTLMWVDGPSHLACGGGRSRSRKF